MEKGFLRSSLVNGFLNELLGNDHQSYNALRNFGEGADARAVEARKPAAESILTMLEACRL